MSKLLIIIMVAGVIATGSFYFLPGKPVDVEKPEFSPSPTPKLQLATVVIVYSSGSFSPSTAVLKKGQMFEFRNSGARSMEIALGEHDNHDKVEGFEETLVQQGKSYFFTIWKNGIYEYHDHLNPNAKGSFVVQD